MNDNIIKAVEIIASDEKLALELINKKTMDEVYDFCVSVHGGYTKEDLDDYMNEIITDDQAIEDILNKDKLENVSGGSLKNVRDKVIAASLVPLMFATSIPFSASAAGGDLQATPRLEGAVESSKVPQKSFWQRHKKKIIALTLSAGALLIGGTLLLKRKGSHQVPEKPKDSSSPGSSNDGSSRPDANHRGTGDDEFVPDIQRQGRRNYNRFVNALAGLPILGQGLIAVATIAAGVEGLGSLAKSISNISGAMWPISNLTDKLRSFARYLSSKRNSAPKDLHQSVDNLEYLFKEVKGQEKAKEEIRSIVYGILHQKKHAELTGKKYARGDVLYFVGPSRVGKSLMASGLAKYKILSPYSEPYRISASEIDTESKTETVMDQLFGMNHYAGYDDYGYYGSSGRGNSVVSKPKNLVKYISEHPNGIVIIDEYDKMWSSNLDELFRTIVDNGVVNIKGQTIDCSGITFILTSNESRESIRGENHGNEKKQVINDGTNSRTYIEHDQSFLNRIRPVEFDNLSAKEYEEIIRTEFKSDLIDYWALPESGGIDIVIREKAVEDMAKAVEKKNRGASYSVDLRNDLFCAITDKVFTAEEKQKQKGYYNGKKIFVDFDPKSNKFILRDEVELNEGVKTE